ncbi:HTH-type transcriptional regulator BhcR [Roseivivax halodurans]|nr:HTH-type transcriptional regulator BhcR [Roseivivax halodurans]
MRRTRGRPRGWRDNRGEYMIKSLDRAMEVLQYVSAHQGLTLSDLAAGLGQAPATVYRTLVTLEGRGLVEFDRDLQTWSMGAQAFVIGAQFLRRTSIVERAKPILRRLMEATGETANLGMVRERSVLFVSQAETHAPIRAFFPPGTLSPLHASGIGKALLAHMPQERFDAFLSVPLPGFTASTLTTRAALLTDCDLTRERGYAVDEEEKTEGMFCVAAPVFDASGDAAAGISVSGPVARFGRDRIANIAVHVVGAAQSLSAAIGAPSSYRA